MIYQYPYVNGTEISVSKKSVYQNSSWTTEGFVWDLNTIQKFADCIEDDFVILDIGAQTGTFSSLAKLYPNTKWHLFEPDPWNYSLLKENLNLNNIQNTILYEEALSNDIGNSILNICPSHRGLNTLGKKLIRFSEEDSIQHQVKTNTIDNLFLNTKVDLIKIDTEGSEYDILRGGIETIKKYKPKILLECCRNLNQFGYEKQDLYDLINELEYEIFWTDGDENIFIRNIERISFSYINNNSITLTKDALKENSATWLSNGSIADIDLIKKFISHIEDGFNILDIGAQSGCFSLAAKFYPNTSWHSFEPDYWNRRILTTNINLNSIKNVKVYEEALSNQVGDSTLTICHFHKGLNTLGKNITRFCKEDSFEFPVKTNTIDNLFLNTQIDLIKIDTEGSEYNILIGARNTIEKYKPKILLEYEERNLNQCGHNIEDLNKFIEEINYEITWISESGRDVFIEEKIKN